MPLMDAGLDSEAVPQLVRSLSRMSHLSGMDSSGVNASLIFEEGSVRAIAARMSSDGSASIAAGAANLPLDVAPIDSSECAVVGIWSCGGARLPAAPHGVPSFAPKLAAGFDAIGSVPGRWEPLADELLPGRAACLRHGGFIAGAEYFDNAAFGISISEASSIDPQQRILLESGEAALHAAGLRRAGLRGSETEVYLATSNVDFRELMPKQSVYAATGASTAVAAGRLSFTLGLQGACITIDTACSSSLSALHAAVLSQQALDGANVALVTAVNLVLTPSISVAYARAGMLSADGRCRTFDRRANGYVRSEGVGSLVLGSGGDAANRVAFSSIAQDGRSASLTAPSGSAQAALLGRAAAQLAGGQRLCLHESHGTGTALGDPIELKAASKGYGSLDGILVGTLKASVGHLEPAAGLAGLLGLVTTLMARSGAPNGQLRVLNPQVSAHVLGQGAALLTQGSQTTSGVAGGVSSFGYSGTIAHAVLEAAPPSLSTSSPPPLVCARCRYSWRAALHPLF